MLNKKTKKYHVGHRNSFTYDCIMLKNATKYMSMYTKTVLKWLYIHYYGINIHINHLKGVHTHYMGGDILNITYGCV